MDPNLALTLTLTLTLQANGNNLARYYDAWPDEYARSG